MNQEVVALGAKTYTYLIDGYYNNNYEKNKIVNKLAKGTKMCVIERINLFLKITKIACLMAKPY